MIKYRVQTARDARDNTLYMRKGRTQYAGTACANDARTTRGHTRLCANGVRIRAT
jgi:hypothetical protein